jgi:DNA invertase Pin-like site-specific DNA recombinase
MNAVIYCRVSTTEQAQNLSLPTQEKACRDYCARHGYTIDQVFVDAGESAKTTDRPEFLRLLESCRHSRGRLHAVVVYSLTRFSRNSADHHAIASLLRGLGIALRSVTEPIDDSPSGRLMEGILAAMAQFDNDVRAERVTAGMKAAVERGRWVWPAPLGYLNADPRRGPSLVPDPERAPAVREAFALCARGVKGRALLAHISALGLRTKHGHPLSSSRLYEMLRQSVYAGRVHHQAWGAAVQGDFTPLVTDEVWGQVQAQLERPHRAAAADKHVNHPDFPLRRFVRCGTCGAALSGSWSRGRRGGRYPFYHCKRGCASITKGKLEEQFLELLEALRPRPEYWRVLRAAVLETWRASKQQATAAHTAARRRLSDVEAKLARVEEAFLFARTIDEVTYRRQRDELREAVAVARIDATEFETEAIDVEGLLAFAEHALEHAAALWTAADTIEHRIAVQWAFFPTGLTFRDGQVGTPSTCLSFYTLPVVGGSDNGLVDLLTPSWNPTLAWLRHLYDTLPRAA